MRAVLTILCLLLAAPAAAEPFTYAKAGLTLEVPTGWSTTLEDGGLGLQVVPPDGNAMLIFYVVPTGGLDAALTELQRAIDAMVKQAKMSTPKEMTLNGMKAVAGDGSGLVDGKAVELGLMIVHPSERRSVLFIGLVPKAGAKKYEPGVTQLLSSLKPTGTPPAKAPASKTGGK